MTDFWDLIADLLPPSGDGHGASFGSGTSNGDGSGNGVDGGGPNPRSFGNGNGAGEGADLAAMQRTFRRLWWPWREANPKPQVGG